MGNQRRLRITVSIDVLNNLHMCKLKKLITQYGGAINEPIKTPYKRTFGKYAYSGFSLVRDKREKSYGHVYIDFNSWGLVTRFKKSLSSVKWASTVGGYW